MLEFLGEINNQLVLFFGVGLGSGLLALIRSAIKEHRCRIEDRMTYQAEISSLNDAVTALKNSADAGEETHGKMWEKMNKMEQDISFIRGHMAQG